MGNSLIEEEMRGWTPTGRFDLVKNPRKLWFEFWKPSEIAIEIYKKGSEFRCYDPEIGYGYSITFLED